MRIKKMKIDKPPFLLFEDGDEIGDDLTYKGIKVLWIKESTKENQTYFGDFFPCIYTQHDQLFPLKSGRCTPDASESMRSFFGRCKIAKIDTSDEKTIEILKEHEML